MASTNQSPFYKKAEENYLKAKDDKERLYWLEEMIRECPKHKSAEKMLANLKTRRIKLLEKIERLRKVRGFSKSSKETIKKAEMQTVLVGFTNSGKSSVLKALTNAQPKISETQFTTASQMQGILDYRSVQIQVIDQPSIKHENFDIGLVNGTDLVLMVVTSISEIPEINNYLLKFKGKRIIIFNKIDLLSESEIRKISETLRSKKYDFVLTSATNGTGIEELKEKIFSSFNIVRIYLKEPGKQPSENPMIMKTQVTIKDIAERIGRNFVNSIRETHIWGPSSKFPNQKVGLNHVLKDKDIVEFKTR